MSDQPQANALPRIFKIGVNRIVEDETMSSMTNDQIRDMLKSSYPEVANATIRETTSDNARLIEFMPQPGRKG